MGRYEPGAVRYEGARRSGRGARSKVWGTRLLEVNCSFSRLGSLMCLFFLFLSFSSLFLSIFLPIFNIFFNFFFPDLPLCWRSGRPLLDAAYPRLGETAWVWSR